MVEVKILSGTNSSYLAEKIADYYGNPLADVKMNRFSDGEMQPVINESVRGAYVFFIQSTFAPAENLMDLLLHIMEPISMTTMLQCLFAKMGI